VTTDPSDVEGTPMTATEPTDLTPDPGWLWPNVLPAAGLLTIVGPAGVGKSLLAADLAAHVTTGSPWPDGSPSPAGNVLLCSGAAADDVIRARLAAAGADPARVHAMVRDPNGRFDDLHWWAYVGAHDQPDVDPLLAIADRPHTLREAHHLEIAAGRRAAVATSATSLLGECEAAVEWTVAEVPGSDVRTVTAAWGPWLPYHRLPLPPPAFRIVFGPEGPRIRWAPAWPDRPRLTDPVAARLFQAIADAGPGGLSLPAQRKPFRCTPSEFVTAARRLLIAEGLIVRVCAAPSGQLIGHRSTVPARAVQ
jgi:hypothetical protein